MISYTLAHPSLRGCSDCQRQDPRESALRIGNVQVDCGTSFWSRQLDLSCQILGDLLVSDVLGESHSRDLRWLSARLGCALVLVMLVMLVQTERSCSQESHAGF
jgi:hypothetical protein